MLNEVVKNFLNEEEKINRRIVIGSPDNNLPGESGWSKGVVGPAGIDSPTGEVYAHQIPKAFRPKNPVYEGMEYNGKNFDKVFGWLAEKKVEVTIHLTPSNETLWIENHIETVKLKPGLFLLISDKNKVLFYSKERIEKEFDENFID